MSQVLALPKRQATVKDEYDAMEIVANVTLISSPDAYNPNFPLTKAKKAVREIQAFVMGLPTQRIRTTEQEQYQQFSTPPHMAYAVAWVANLRRSDVLLEPSAGTGCLAMWGVNAAVSAIYANELHPGRAEVLDEFKFDAVWRHDAQFIDNVLPAGVRPTVVLMNPPFSRSPKMGARREPMLAALHLEAALRALAPSGRLVAVLPGHYRICDQLSENYALWWSKLAKENTIQACIGLPGKEYAKYGTSYPTCVAVIDKIAPTSEHSIRRGEVANVGDLLAALEQVRNARPEVKLDAPNDGFLFKVPSFLNAFDVQEIEDAKPLAIAEITTQPDNSPLTEAVYEPYSPQRIKIIGAKPHPSPLVQSAAMASVLPPAPLYQPMIPQSLIDSGVLSDAQLEAITYAGAAFQQFLEPERSPKWLPDIGDFGDEYEQVRFRRGFFIGDGTGVGKGREISGVIVDDMARRKGQGGRAIWISKTGKLIEDARRDWKDLGGEPDDIIPLSRFKPGDVIEQPIPGRRRILFASYALLRSGRTEPLKNRLRQIINWVGKDFDGVIAFDEAHGGKNAAPVKGERGTGEPSETALAMIDLQRALPNAKVLYCSATGATEVQNLAYGTRLGLWGRGTAFANQNDFIASVAAGGVAAMELVSRDMKQQGMYIARGLSFDGVEYDRLLHVLNADQREIYNKLCEAWQIILQNFEEALKLVASRIKKGNRYEGEVSYVDPKIRGVAMSAFYGGMLRFFNQVITSMQMPSVLADMEKELDTGNCCVLQLVNTNEAVQERQLARLEEDDEIDLEDIDLTPRENILQLLEHSFPVHQFEEYLDPDTNTKKMRLALDGFGKKIINQRALALRDRLINEVASIRVPEGPLEMVINHFGVTKVAEITGRSRRVIKVRDIHGEHTEIENRSKAKCLADVAAFQDDRKRILIFSDAGGTGASYHSDKKARNQRRRIHYLIQAGWVADAAVQGFGRTHRSHQAIPPLYKLVSTDLKGQKRFISTIARRLDQLGALTKGQRQTGSNGIYKATDNLESQYARSALRVFYEDLHKGEIDGVDVLKFEKMTGLKLTDDDGGLREETPPINRFLNRLMALQIDMQNLVFDAFAERLERIVQNAIDAGTFDVGVETLLCDKCEKLKEQIVHTDERSGAQTKHVVLRLFYKNKPRSWKDLTEGEEATYYRKVEFFAKNAQSGHVYAFTLSSDRTEGIGGKVIKMYRQLGPIHQERVPREDVDTNPNWLRLDPAVAKKEWAKAVKASPKFSEETIHLITGAVLPIWDRFRGDPKVKRVRTDEGERLLGRVIEEEDLTATLRNLGVDAGEFDTFTLDKVVPNLLAGTHKYELANGWTLKMSKVRKQKRVEIVGPDYRFEDQLQADGIVGEKIDFTLRFFVPTGADLPSVLAQIIKTRPIVDCVRRGAVA